MNVRLLLLLLIPGANSIAQDLINTTSPPKIIKTTPEFGDCNVDPGINEIVIIFDQDMSNGMSVVNTPFMPKINGDARWIDKRTFVIPVLLRPNSQYQLAFNSLRYTNFRSENGLALNPDELIFITRSVDATTQNKEAYQELFRYFPDYYSYSDLRGIDWHSEFKQSQTEFENSRTSLEFALKLIRILKKADDPHLWVEVDGQRYETGKVKITERNYEPAYIFRILQNKILDKRFTAVVGNHDSIGYIMLRDWNTDFKMLSLQAWGNANNPVIPTKEVLHNLFRFPDLIIDVRENRGGDENFARQFASLFTKDSLPFEKVEYFNESSGNFDKKRIKWLHPNNEGIYYPGNIFVLTGPAVMSSNESFLLMMKQIPKARLIGMKSYGSTANPVPVDLSNGVRIYIPSWRAYTMDGELIEGNGIKPDIEIITNPEQFSTGTDILFQEALKIIKNGK